MLDKITVKKLNALVVTPSNHNSKELALTLNALMMQQGFIMSEQLFKVVETLSAKEFTELYSRVGQLFKQLKGSHVVHKPMYPNFPQQVIEMSHLDLYFNAIVHYWTQGEWMPHYDQLPRELHFEKVKLRTIGLATDEDLNILFNKMITSNESLSEEDKSFIIWFIENGYTVPDNIPYKENMCYVAGLLLSRGEDIRHFVKTSTDVLRIVTFLNGGDISLSTNTKFKSMPRKLRKTIIKLIEDVASDEDINRHKNKWVRLFHSLHVGEYSPELYNGVVAKIRNNEKITTFNSQVESALRSNVIEAIDLLTQRPGEFVRRIDHLLRLSNENQIVTKKFLKVINSVPTRTLVQLLGHMKNRDQYIKQRIVYPKGSTQKATILPQGIAPLKEKTVKSLRTGIEKSLIERFSSLEPLGKVWIDPALKDCPLPTQQRSASEGLDTVARGTKLPFGDESKNTLRFFCYWVGQDIDLSATLHDENFRYVDHVSYTQLTSRLYQSHHSGDITRAPNGATEFIDITIDGAIRSGARYVVMNVYVFSGPNFSEHEEVFAGWMTREKPKSNEIFDPKTVEQKVNIVCENRNSIPVVFDLVERKAIWMDIGTSTRVSFSGGWGTSRNNVESNRVTIEHMLQAAVRTSEVKMNLYDLFSLHASARGKIVKKRSTADYVMSIDREGDVTPYDITEINSQFIV